MKINYDGFLDKNITDKLNINTSIQVTDSIVHYNTEDKWKVHLYLTLVKVFLNERILSSNIHWNCSVLWFNKAIVCCTGKCSCITPVDVCYSQHLSFLHHTSISLVHCLSLVQVLFGSDRPEASHANCKLLPSRTVGLPLIPLIFFRTKSN